MDFLIEQITKIVENTSRDAAVQNLSEATNTSENSESNVVMSQEQFTTLNGTMEDILYELRFLNDKQRDLIALNQSILDQLMKQTKSESEKTRLVEDTPKTEVKKTTKAKSTKK